MAKRKFSEEKIFTAVKQLEAGWTAAELGREEGVRAATIYSWKAKYDAMSVSEPLRVSADAAYSDRERFIIQITSKTFLISPDLAKRQPRSGRIPTRP